ncbi:chalcone isomerase family protein [Agarivorans sp.]|uniref:chalcone isomerase family protein n=1 Tax=Agarivorans sp. TaxID=1872412 RepID=UPI003D011D33
MLNAILLAALLSSASVPNSALQKVGEAQLRWLFWPIYQVSLHSPDGQYQPQRYPMSLSIHYLRDIKQSALLEATQDEWQRLGVCQQAPCQRWLGQLAEIWPDLQQGDQLQLFAASADQATFYLNGQALGKMNDDLFSQHFLDIWLSENSRFPEQQQALVGGE